MGLVKIGDEITKDRRQNGARIKLDFSDWWKIITVVIVVILGIGNLKWTVNNNSELLAEQGKEIKITKELSRDNRKDIENMKETIARIDDNVVKLLKK